MRKFYIILVALSLSSAIFAQNTYRSLTLQTATVNSTTQSGSAPEFTVSPGASITGTYEVLFETDYPSSHVFPLACTPNWGNKQSDYWQDQSSMSNGSSYSGNISLTAPSTAGTYYIIMSVASEYNAGQIVSATHWGASSNVWDDGNDLFDLTTTEINTGISTGSLTHPMWGGSSFSDNSYGLTAIKIVVSGSTSNTYRKLTLQSATINGSTQSVSNPEFSVAIGTNITGTYNVLFETDYPSSHVFPLACTPNWGNKQNDYWQDQSSMSNGSSYSGNISLTAPSTAGTYYIIMSVASEYNAGQIVSATHWGASSNVWDDGNDLFDLSSSEILTGINTGSLTHPMWGGSSFSDNSYGLTAIKLDVGTSSINDNSNNEEIFIYPNPVKNNLTIELNSEIQLISVELYDVLGKTVYTKSYKSNSVNLNLTDFEAGTYILKVKNNEGQIIKTEKIVKK